jgi:hypothetical protein
MNFIQIENEKKVNSVLEYKSTAVAAALYLIKSVLKIMHAWM